MFVGTHEQLSNALREVERRGGQAGSIAGAAADEIERLSIMAYQPAGRHDEQCDCIQCLPF